MGRVLAIDLGTKRVGLAITDPLKIIASPYRVLNYLNDDRLLNDISKICSDEDVELIVVGYPLLENGEKSMGCFVAEKFCKLLQSRGLKCRLWDERYSSRIAESIVKEYGKSRKNSMHKIDKLAASIILESYLSAMNEAKNRILRQ